MDKGAPSSLFVNDGSFMERFKQLEQDKGKDQGKSQEKDKGAGEKDSKPKPIVTGTPKSSAGKINMKLKRNDANGSSQAASGGKLAFSLKQKSKLVAPVVKLGADEEDEDELDAENVPVDAKRQKLGQPEACELPSRHTDVGNYCLYRPDAYELPSRHTDVAPLFPSDPTVKKVADKLASFVAKNGRQFEDITRQKNPGDTPFKFLFDKSCSDYKYYEHQLAEEEKFFSETKDSKVSASGGISTSAPKSADVSQRSHQQANYQIPASALYEASEEPHSGPSAQTSTGRTVNGESSSSGSDPIAMMEFYMKKAAQEERKRQPKYNNDEMPPPASLQAASAKRGHHMGDYIPQEELEKFMSSCNDVAAQKAAREAAEKARIQADNVGHKLLSKMGWKEGEGLGSSRSGISDPIAAGNVKKDNLGVGAQNPGEVAPDDDIYEQYKKRMMLGYRYRPNPLNNPRKAYY